ncbi:MAG: hypoxanthine phosphoribosyltransferase [Corallococcus sp.]|nr:hypoxanthine phosphoribosyltransferase [Corallococcus sp.]MCM1359626.1 hypoxanthine phosphoribosyltransferase [Corallococcus sp.]MCM1395218.1 hypoxanthine phosphoribosyltransferase [Corallococcus sp.]
MKQICQVLLTRRQIEQRVKEIARQILHDYNGKCPLLVGVLKGSLVFLADLVRNLGSDAELDFLSVSSYGGGTVSNGNPVLRQDMCTDCKNRDVLIVEDIVDSGKTVEFLTELLATKGAKSVKTAALLSKPVRRTVEVDVDYVGFEIDDKFVVGYGMDFDEKYRGLSDICVLNKG